MDLKNPWEMSSIVLASPPGATRGSRTILVRQLASCYCWCTTPSRRRRPRNTWIWSPPASFSSVMSVSVGQEEVQVGWLRRQRGLHSREGFSVSTYTYIYNMLPLPWLSTLFGLFWWKWPKWPIARAATHPVRLEANAWFMRRCGGDWDWYRAPQNPQRPYIF